MAYPSLSETFLFSLSLEEISALQDKKLCVEYGQYHLSLSISNKSGDTIYHIAFYQFKSRPDVRIIQQILIENQVYLQTFSDVILVHNQKENALLPSSMYKQELEQTLLETIHGDIEAMIIMNDDVHQWELNNIYGCNRYMFNMMRDKYPHIRNNHFTTLALRSIFRNIKYEKENWLKIYFYPTSLQVFALKGDQLLMAQSFYYETKEDVVFHLLNLSDKFNIDLASSFVEVSGLIDEESGIWKELNRYILNIQFEIPPQIALQMLSITTVPIHFLTPIMLIAKCV